MFAGRYTIKEIDMSADMTKFGKRVFTPEEVDQIIEMSGLIVGNP
jgi:hypothetical protein